MRIPRPATSAAIVVLAFAIGPVGAQVRVEPAGPWVNGNHGVVLPTLTPTLTPTVIPGPGNPTVSSDGGGAQVLPGGGETGLSGDDGIFKALADAVDRDQVIEGTPLVKKRRLLLGDE